MKDVANPETIDSTGAPVGPFGILDIVGMEIPYQLMQGQNDTGAQN